VDKIAYAKAVFRRQYCGAPLTSGTLEAGKVYQFLSIKSGDDFTNVGADSDQRLGSVFKATGTTPTSWANGTKLSLINVAGLKTLSLQVFDAATNPGVTLTQLGFEGGSGTGVLTFEKSLLGQAIEEMLAELDPDYVAPATVPRQEIGMTVRLPC
jgi:hypothetical protein